MFCTLTAAAPVQHFATSKDINEAFIWGISSPQLVHEMHGHAHKLNGQASSPAHCGVHNGKTDGDALPCSQHERQQGVAGVVIVLTVSLQAERAWCMA